MRRRRKRIEGGPLLQTEGRMESRTNLRYHYYSHDHVRKIVNCTWMIRFLVHRRGKILATFSVTRGKSHGFGQGTLKSIVHKLRQGNKLKRTLNIFPRFSYFLPNRGGPVWCVPCDHACLTTQERTRRERSKGMEECGGWVSETDEDG